MRLLLIGALAFSAFAAVMALGHFGGVVSGSPSGHIYFMFDVPAWAEGLDAAWRIAMWSFWALVVYRRLRAPLP